MSLRILQDTMVPAQLRVLHKFNGESEVVCSHERHNVVLILGIIVLIQRQ